MISSGKINVSLTFLSIFVLALSSLFALSFAVPQQPTNFWGYVYLGYDSHDASTDTAVTAKIDSVEYASTLTYNGNFYSFQVPTDDSGIPEKDGAEYGDNISLYVEGVYSNSWIFTAPGSSVWLDLYINRPPELNSIADITITETETATITPSATDADTDTVTFLLNDPNFIKNGNSYEWVTDYDDEGVYTVRVTASDGAKTDYQDVTITVLDSNRAPVADPASVSTDEDTALSITLTGSDDDGDSLIYSVVTGPSHGTLSGTAPSLTYTPDADYNGDDSFTFNVNDGTEDSNTATISITVNSVNDVPVANPASVSTDEDTALSITLTGSDVDGDSLTYTVLTGPSHGTLSGTAPSLTYTPDPNYNSTDSFTFNVNDGTVDSNTATVSITVTPVNDAPVLDAIADITVNERDKIIIQPNATDVDGDSLTFSTNNSNLTWNDTSEAFEWTPDYLDSGNYTITLTVSDNIIEDSKVFNIEVKDKYHRFDRELKTGWNLISIPYVLDNHSIDDALSTIDGNYNVVWSYNSSLPETESWQSYNPLKPFDANTLKELYNVEGFWIDMTQDDTLTVIGTIWTVVEQSVPPYQSVMPYTKITLNPGWNLISFPFSMYGEVECMLSQIEDSYTVVWQYNETAPGPEYERWSSYDPAKPDFANTLHNFTPGFGYWINMIEADELLWGAVCVSPSE